LERLTINRLSRTLRQAAIEGSISYCDFIDTMLGEPAEEHLHRM
jgi:hypothetical protein